MEELFFSWLRCHLWLLNRLVIKLVNKLSFNMLTISVVNTLINRLV